jgi:hypothetical protein
MNTWSTAQHLAERLLPNHPGTNYAASAEPPWADVIPDELPGRHQDSGYIESTTLLLAIGVPYRLLLYIH